MKRLKLNTLHGEIIDNQKLQFEVVNRDWRTLMRCFAVVISLFFPIGSSFSQIVYANTATGRDVTMKEVIDSVELSVKYRAKVPLDMEGDRFFYDNQCLEIGDRFNRYYSIYAEHMDSISYWAQQSGGRGSFSRHQGLELDEWGVYEDIFSNYPDSGDIYVQTQFVHNIYSYKEPIPKFGWQLTGRTTTVLDYSCIEAVAEFRGRRFYAYFTVEIPYSYGPWKFMGLPGLILQVRSDDDNYSWTAYEVSQLKDRAIYRYDLEETECDRQDIRVLYDLRWQDRRGLFLYAGAKQGYTITKDGEIEEARAGSNPLPEIPQLELE